MKKLIVLLIAITVLSNCNARRKKVEKISIQKENVFKKQLDSFEIKKDSAVVIKEQKEKLESSVNDNNGDIIIKGNTTLEVPFEYYNVVDKDTLNSILIKGNAEFEIKNNWKKETVKSEKSNIEKDINIVAKVARIIVAKETIEKASEEIKATTKDIKTNDFSFKVYILGGVFGIVFILLAFYSKKIKLYLKSIKLFRK